MRNTAAMRATAYRGGWTDAVFGLSCRQLLRDPLSICEKCCLQSMDSKRIGLLSTLGDVG